MDGNFSNIPPDTLNAIVPTWGEPISGASALLGILPLNEIQDTTNDDTNLRPGSVLDAVRDELVLRPYMQLEKAAVAFFDRISGGGRDNKNILNLFSADVIHTALAECFDVHCLPLNDAALQALINKCATDSDLSGVYTPLLTAWIERREQEGNFDRSITLAWPTIPENEKGAQDSLRHIVNFGHGLKDIDVTIRGSIRGTLGMHAINCNFTVDSVEGEVLWDAKNSTLTTQSLDASAHGLRLGHGCAITADIIRCREIRPRFHDLSAVTITARQIYGVLKPGDNWVVDCDEIISPETSDDNYEVTSNTNKSHATQYDVWQSDLVNELQWHARSQPGNEHDYNSPHERAHIPVDIVTAQRKLGKTAITALFNIDPEDLETR